jgi:hypothetical protein
MTSSRKKMALEAIREDKTLTQIASAYGVHPVQVTNGKKCFSMEPLLYSPVQRKVVAILIGTKKPTNGKLGACRFIPKKQDSVK